MMVMRSLGAGYDITGLRFLLVKALNRSCPENNRRPDDERVRTQRQHTMSS